MRTWQSTICAVFYVFWCVIAAIQLALAMLWATESAIMALLHLCLLVLSVFMIRFNRKEFKDCRIHRACGGEG